MSVKLEILSSIMLENRTELVVEMAAEIRYYR